MIIRTKATIPALVALLLAAGCADNADNAAGNAEASAPANNVVVEAPSSAPGTLPPADANLRFIGLWASDAESCKQYSWIFSERALETAGGVVCHFDRINQVPGGYDIASTCTAETEETKDTVRLRFSESAGAMLIGTDTVLEDVGLVYCGPAGEAAPPAAAGG